MDIGVIGISYKSSELELRESFLKTCYRLLEHEKGICVVLLSTCNRTEIYFSSSSVVEMHSEILTALKKMAENDFEKRIYSYFKELCFVHLAKVSSGVDSLIFGEAEIQRQVKLAYEEAKLRYLLPSSLHYLFQKSLKLSKSIRTEFELPKGAVSLESTIWDLAKCFFREKRPISILLVGYSKINRKIIHFFKNKQGVLLHLVTRNPKIGEERVKEVSFIPWSSLDSWSSFDMVISGSKCSGYLLQSEQIPKDPSLIRSRLVVDLGVPRNVEPGVGKNPLITLFNIEDLGGVIDHRKITSLHIQKEVEKEIEKRVYKQTAIYQKRKERVSLCMA